MVAAKLAPAVNQNIFFTGKKIKAALILIIASDIPLSLPQFSFAAKQITWNKNRLLQ